MSEAGKQEARRLLRYYAIEQRVLEEGRHPITISMVGAEPRTVTEAHRLGELDAVTFEQHVAVRVRYACGYRDERGRARGGCGATWARAKLEGDPDPPADPTGDHRGCVDRAKSEGRA